MWRHLAIAALVVATAGVGQAEDPAFRGDIHYLTRQNDDFRRVLFTGRNTQVVAMTLHPGEDIGEEIHEVDQCFFFVQGTAQTLVGGSSAATGPNGVLCVPAGARHNIRNAGQTDVKLFTTYSPPQHPPGTVHHSKLDAQRAEAEKAG